MSIGAGSRVPVGYSCGDLKCSVALTTPALIESAANGRQLPLRDFHMGSISFVSDGLLVSPGPSLVGLEPVLARGIDFWQRGA